MAKRLLLTGIGGSAGCHFFRHIMQNTDWEVVGIDSFRHKGLWDRLEVMLRAHPEDRDRLQVITQDLRSPISDLTRRKIGHVDYILNVAALSDVHASLQTPRPFIEGNIEIALTMLDYARATGCEVFVQFSTDEVFGPTDGKSMHGEWDPIVPSNPYSASKAGQDAAAISYWRSYGVPLIITHSMNMVGEMQSSAKFPAIIQRNIRARKPITIHGSPGNVGSRVYIHSRNTADALLYILKKVCPNQHVDGTVDKPARFNIVGDRQVNNEELVWFIAKCIGEDPIIRYEDSSVTRPGHDAHYGLDDACLHNIGWKQPVPFEESMRNVVKWQQEHPEWLE